MPTRCFIVASFDDAWVPWTEGMGPLDNQRVGAMLYWSHGRGAELQRLDTQPRPMPHLAVMTAAGLACLDCPATGGDKQPGRYWARTGEPPNITVTPSLDVAEGSPHRWHGFLQDGVLTP